MDVEVTMPDLSTTGEEIVVVEWLVDVGQPVRRGQPLLVVETDKATMEVESVESGTLKSQIAKPDSEIAVGEVIAILEVRSTSSSVATPKPDGDREQSLPRSAENEANEPAEKPLRASNMGPGVQATKGMFARNWQAIKTAEKFPAISMSNTQQVVGRRMEQSKQSIPHYYLKTSANAEPMLRQRASCKPEKTVWDAFFVCAMAKALKKYPRITCRIHDDLLMSEATGAIGVAVDIDGDLFVVRISDAADKTPATVSNEIVDAVNNLMEGDRALRKLRPADITITNLGMANVESFTPIINPPEVAILGVGKVMPQATVSNGEIGVEHRVSLTLSVDHRIANGKYAAEFLGCLVKHIESF